MITGLGLSAIRFGQTGTARAKVQEDKELTLSQLLQKVHDDVFKKRLLAYHAGYDYFENQEEDIETDPVPSGALGTVMVSKERIKPESIAELPHKDQLKIETRFDKLFQKEHNGSPTLLLTIFNHRVFALDQSAENTLKELALKRMGEAWDKKETNLVLSDMMDRAIPEFLTMAGIHEAFNVENISLGYSLHPRYRLKTQTKEVDYFA